ncbi:nuclear transport factor 2 family protein [Nocardia sp. NPDC052112]|uniref:nuclear transport factor 2 family protein n=1 Tax=Nocardia sp. NPDC052112 TaxID=3155646 RepID=UPI00343DB98D
MSKDISLTELQELLGAWWLHYDAANYDELAAMLAPEVKYTVRSDTGQTEYEEFIRADLQGREATMEWLKPHRLGSPTPLRHMGINLHRTGIDRESTTFASYLLTTQVTNGLPQSVASAIVTGAVARGPEGLWFTAQHIVLDTQNSVTLAEAEAVRAAK